MATTSLSSTPETMKIKAGLEADFATAEENNSKDGYSACGFRYLNVWALLMEAKMAEGHALKDIAEATSREADTEGITGFMYACAVSTLAHFWEHGEELRKWHNKEYGYEGGGTVNPAILTVEI
jgi:hypothetical protein